MGGPPRRRAAALLALAAGLALVVAAFLTRDGPQPDPAPRQPLAEGAPDQTAPAAQPPPPVGSAAEPREPGLAGTLLEPPAGFQRAGDDAAATGPLDVAGAVEVDGAGGLRADEFAALGLQAAHSRVWHAADGSLHVIAYRFADPQGAAEFVTRSGAPDRVRDGATEFGLGDPPGVRAYRMRVGDEPLQVALFALGPRAYVVGLRGPLADDPAGGLLREVVAAQVAAAS